MGCVNIDRKQDGSDNVCNLYACIRRTASVYDNEKQFAKTSRERKKAVDHQEGGAEKKR